MNTAECPKVHGIINMHLLTWIKSLYFWCEDLHKYFLSTFCIKYYTTSQSPTRNYNNITHNKIM